MKQIPSILVVDDDPVIAELVAETLRSATMDATVVTDGAEVLERLGREAYDLVILDVMMPGVSGYEGVRPHPRHLQPAGNLPLGKR